MLPLKVSQTSANLNLKCWAFSLWKKQDNVLTVDLIQRPFSFLLYIALMFIPLTIAVAGLVWYNVYNSMVIS